MMSQLTDTEVYQEIGKIIKGFPIYRCYNCAKAISQWAISQSIEITLLELKTRDRSDFIVSDRLGGNQSITMNGKHYGALVRGLVFDNLSRTGMNREEWIQDFHSQTDDFILNELEP